jgi:hypothetical protein
MCSISRESPTEEATVKEYMGGCALGGAVGADGEECFVVFCSGRGLVSPSCPAW